MKKSSQKFRFVRYSYRSVDGQVIHSEATYSPAVTFPEAQAHLRSQFAGSVTPLLSVNDTPEPAPVPPFGSVAIQEPGSFSYVKDGCNHSASFPLFLIRHAWEKGCDLEELADGFGPGAGTMGDWSGIRDSSDTAIAQMLERSLNFLGLTT